MKTDEESFHDRTGHEFQVAESRQSGRVDSLDGRSARCRSTLGSFAGGTSGIHSDYSGVVL